jgi:hypothetical protein
MSRLYKIGSKRSQGFIRVSNPSAALNPATTLFNYVIGGGSELGPEESESPTGMRPIFVWTPHRQWLMEQKHLNNHWTWQKLYSWALLANPYGDRGQHKAFVYQTTGDISYAAGAFTKLITTSASEILSGNNVRGFLKSIFTADILMPYILADSSRLTQWQTEFFRRIDHILNVRGARINDSDEVNSFLLVISYSAFMAVSW